MVKTHATGRKTKIIATFVIILIAGAGYLLGWSPFFTVKEITVVGAPTTAEASMIEQTSRIIKGEKLARLEPRNVRALLRNVSWLDHSTVNRNWIRGLVVIRVWPRTPVATYRGQLMDRGSNVFDLPNINSRTLPLIIAGNRSSAQFAISVLTLLPTTLQSDLVGLTVASLNSATLSLRNISPSGAKILQVVWGDTSSMDLKVKVYQALIRLPENVNISEIDLSAPHAPIVK